MSESHEWTAGDRILGRYEVISVLGKGGMGIVYRCIDTVADTLVAVKGLIPGQAKPEDLVEIKENFQLVAALRHPSIAGLRNIEQDADGTYYLVMDYIDGHDLTGYIHNHTPSLESLFIILDNVAGALDYAHENGIIHRDIKPDNIKIDTQNTIKVLDFGIATAVSSNRASDAGGTPEYMAPEQWYGEAQTGATDQYALAALAYRCLYGKVPHGDMFRQETDMTKMAHAVSQNPVTFPVGTPAAVQEVFRRALANAQADRYPTCTDFVNALAYATGHRRPPRKSRLGWIIAAVVVLVAAGVTGYLVLQNRQAKASHQAEQDALVQFYQQKIEEMQKRQRESTARTEAERQQDQRDLEEMQRKLRDVEDRKKREQRQRDEKAAAEELKKAQEAEAARERQEQAEREKQAREKAERERQTKEEAARARQAREQAAVAEVVHEKPKIKYCWTFDGTLKDRSGKREALLDGKAKLEGGQVVLPGGAPGSGAVNLGPGLLPGDKAFTLEIWFTPRAVKRFARLFTLEYPGAGSAGELENILALLLNRGGSANQGLLCVPCTGFHENLGWTSGVAYHEVVTGARRTDGKLNVSWYRGRAGDPDMQHVTTINGTSWRPDTTALWIGRSHWVSHGDEDAAIDVNEVRVWEGDFDEEMLRRSHQRGAVKDAQAPEPAPVERTLTLAHRWKSDADLIDSIGKRKATKYGAVSVMRNSVQLRGGANWTSLVDLGTDVIPSDGSPFTLELWCSQDSLRDESRIFEVAYPGFSVYNGFLWCWSCFGPNCQARIGPAIAPTDYGFKPHQEYHLALAFAKTPEGRYRGSFMSRPVGGASVIRCDSAEIDSIFWAGYEHFYLGHSVNERIPDASCRFSEVRVWKGAFTKEDFERSHKAGPDRVLKQAGRR